MLVGRAALGLDGRGDLGTDLVPEPARPRRREGLQLQGGVADHGGRGVDLLGRLVDLEAQLHAGHAAHPQRPEVDAAVAALDLGDVERAAAAVELDDGGLLDLGVDVLARGVLLHLGVDVGGSRSGGVL